MIMLKINSKKKLIVTTASLMLMIAMLASSCSSDTKDKETKAKDTAVAGAKIDFAKAPGKDFKATDPVLAPAPTGKVHNIELTMEEIVKEVSPGVTQELWTFNKQSPGPILHGKIGDTFNVKLTNNGKIGHSMDFHAGYAPWDTQMRTIASGETIEYNFVAEYSGIWMYHCGTSPALHHIGNGMFGAVVIDPPDLAPVDHEYIILQNEIYTGAEGKPGYLTKMKNDKWYAIVFNGYVNQYLHQPIKVGVNDRVRVWVMDVGPSENSSFHIVGTIFDTVYKEGAYLVRGGPGASQALDLQPAQGGFVEFNLKHEGLYPIVTHKFSNVGKGALGLFQAGDPKPPAGGGGH
jgi:nitrite reductase (NO-forming)